MPPRPARAPAARPTCARCGTPLVPGFKGMRCPRGSACGYGGLVESPAVGARAGDDAFEDDD